MIGVYPYWQIVWEMWKQEINMLVCRAYKSYFDPETRFMRGRDSKGNGVLRFNPRSSTHRSDDYCEGTAWQWTWFVPHDVPVWLA